MIQIYVTFLCEGKTFEEAIYTKRCSLGITESELMEGTQRSTMEQLKDWATWADKVVTF